MTVHTNLFLLNYVLLIIYCILYRFTIYEEYKFFKNWCFMFHLVIIIMESLFGKRRAYRNSVYIPTCSKIY
jgi:hypothetical protein